jgi:hypothetical protein
MAMKETKPDPAPEPRALMPEAAAAVAGGINPQPLPPIARQLD